MYNINNGAIWWLVSTAIKVVLEHFPLHLSIFQILCIYDKFCDLENISQCHDVQHSQRYHSMASLNLYKRQIWAFSASSHCFQILNIWFSDILWSWKYRSTLRCTTFAMVSVNLYKRRFENFLLALTVFHVLNVWFPEFLWPRKNRSRSRCTTLAMAPFDG